MSNHEAENTVSCIVCMLYLFWCMCVCDWQERMAVADSQVNNQSINQSINQQLFLIATYLSIYSAMYVGNLAANQYGMGAI